MQLDENKSNGAAKVTSNRLNVGLNVGQDISLEQSSAIEPSESGSAFELTPERAFQLMLQRAEKLAQFEQEATDLTTLEVVTFALANERYAIESRFIREIATFHGCTYVPGAPDFVAGIINLHGQIVALMDLKRLFGLPREASIAEAKVIVLGGEQIEFAILADSVDRVLKLKRSEIIESPSGTNAGGRERLLGVTLDALIVLDGEALMDDKRLFVNQTNDAL